MRLPARGRGIKQTHEIVREAHRQRQQRRIEIATTEGDFDGVKAARQASKIASKADRAEIVDVYDMDIFEQSLATAMLAHLEASPKMQVAASKTAFEILRHVEYKPSLTKQMLVGSQALAVELVIERVMMAAEEVIRHLSMLRHEDFPAMCDASQVAESDALRRGSRRSG